MTKPNLQDILYNEKRILDLETSLAAARLQLAKCEYGSPKYRKQYLVVHHYQLELAERKEFRKKEMPTMLPADLDYWLHDQNTKDIGGKNE